MPQFFYRILIVFLATISFSACGLLRKPMGALSVSTSTAADVYLDGKNIGTTPLDKYPLEVKKYQLKVVPTDPSLLAQETNIKLFPKIETIVEWNFGESRDESSGFTLEVENAHKRDASELEIVTSPDNVPITLNGENSGFSPVVIDDLPVGEYQLGLQAPGYSQAAKGIRLIEGKRLIVNVKLARKPLEVSSPSATLAATPMPTPTTATPKPTPKATPKATSVATGSATAKKPYVLVLDTPTGFLRVRAAPINGEVLGQLNVGDTAPYGGQTKDNWFKIVFGATSSAWVSGQYSQLFQ